MFHLEPSRFNPSDARAVAFEIEIKKRDEKEERGEGEREREREVQLRAELDDFATRREVFFFFAGDLQFGAANFVTQFRGAACS